MSTEPEVNRESMSPTARREPAAQRERRVMDFPEAIKRVASGAKVTKLEWEDDMVFLVLRDNKVMINSGTFNDGKLHPFVMQYGDIVGDDWVSL
jgi:hypothetical protein